MADLQRKNRQLHEDLDEAREAADSLSQPKRGSRGGATCKQLQTKVDALRKQVAELERVRALSVDALVLLLIQPSKGRERDK